MTHFISMAMPTLVTWHLLQLPYKQSKKIYPIIQSLHHTTSFTTSGVGTHTRARAHAYVDFLGKQSLDTCQLKASVCLV